MPDSEVVYGGGKGEEKDERTDGLGEGKGEMEKETGREFGRKRMKGERVREAKEGKEEG